MFCSVCSQIWRYWVGQRWKLGGRTVEAGWAYSGSPASPAASVKSHATMPYRLVVDVGHAIAPVAVFTSALRKQTESLPKPGQGVRPGLQGERTDALSNSIPAVMLILPRTTVHGRLRSRIGHPASMCCQTRPSRGTILRRPVRVT